jgi:hypothetical protein
MDADVIEQIIARELSAGAFFDNAHGITPENIVQHCLRPPIAKRFENAGIPGGDTFVDAWIVLDECPGSADTGYLVVFYTPESMFGLAVKGTPHPIFLGCYGSLADTLTAM